MGIKLPVNREDNAMRANLDSAYLRILDVESIASSGNVRIQFYIYADKEARDLRVVVKKAVDRGKDLPPLPEVTAPLALPVRQGVEVATSAEFSPVFLAELDALRAVEDGRKIEEKIRDAYFKAGYFFLKSRGYAGVDC